jgi:four helix bundle protein
LAEDGIGFFLMVVCVAVRQAVRLGVAMHYEDSVVWRKAMRLAVAACRQAACLPSDERFGMRSQLTRSAISVPCNIAEGWNRGSRKEKAQFLAIAHGSLAELNTQLIISVRLGWLSASRVDPIISLIDETGRMLTKLRQQMRKNPFPTQAK